MRFAISGEISSPDLTNNSSVIGSTTSCNDTRPSSLSLNDSTISSFFLSGSTNKPLKVPQSSSLIITSCETSTKRRVK